MRATSSLSLRTIPLSSSAISASLSKLANVMVAWDTSGGLQNKHSAFAISSLALSLFFFVIVRDLWRKNSSNGVIHHRDEHVP
jgi:hypothetical protein